MDSNAEQANFVEHSDEVKSNKIRRSVQQLQPRSQRTRTPTLTVIARSEDCYHFTPEGRRLADFSSGVLVANLGHNPPQWWRRVLDYMKLGDLTSADCAQAAPLTAYNAITEVEELATRRLLANLTAQAGGDNMEQLLWAASGSEAIQKGIWACMAYKPHEQPIILATRFGFHGKKGLAGAVTGTEDDPERDARVRFLSFPKHECNSLDDRQQPIDLSSYQSELSTALEQFGDRICCLCTEPYLGGGGSYHPQPEYLQLLQRFCNDNQIPLMLDEVQSNFGRTGEMYAFTHYGLSPDLVVLGKGMGNGMPVDAVAGRRDILSSLNYGEGSDTWSGHPIGCAAVLATLDEFEQGDVLRRGRELSTKIKHGLLRLLQLPVIAAVRGEGTVWGVECAAIGDRTAEEMANELVHRCYLGDEQGRAIHLLGPLAGRVVRVAPPIVMDVGEAEVYLDAMYKIACGLA